MNQGLTRRGFLQGSLAGGAGMFLASPVLVCASASKKGEDMGGVCLTVCNHWSYIGIGWSLGIESCVVSVVDAMEMADRPPHVKTCINLDARAYEFMAEKFPEVTERLKRYLKEGKVELIGGTYGQPMGTTISGESNIRQIVMGRELIQKVLDYPMVTFLEEEEFTHPQIPQMAALAGFRYASLAQLDTWGRAGCPKLDMNVLSWKGIDGTTIPCVPKNALFGFAPDPEKLAASDEFKQLAALGKPLIFAWEEFGWESEEQPAYLSAPERYAKLANVEFVTLKEYLDKYGGVEKEGGAGARAATQSAKLETVYLPMDAWNKSLTWGLGGDQTRIMDRKVDGLLLAAETFDAIASALGGPSQVEALQDAWRNLLASQSHDVGLCEYSRWQGERFAPFDRVEDKHNFTWGNLGYNHLDAAQKLGQAVLDGALGYLGSNAAIFGDVEVLFGRERAGIVFNPHGWYRSGVASTGRIHPVPPKCRYVMVTNSDGRTVPSQMVKKSQDSDGNLIVADVAFYADAVPSAGYEAYHVKFVEKPQAPVETALRIDEKKLSLENECLRVGLDPVTGGIASLVDKRTGEEVLDVGAGAFPRLTGRPNPNLSTKPNPPAFYDSKESKAQIDWLAKGPLFAVVRAQHAWPYMKFETRVTLSSGSPYVEVDTRVLAQVPPHSDAAPADIREGYWLCLRPAFPAKQVIRDYPFGAEETKHAAFHALSFVDLLGEDRGLLLLHMGTQFFKRDENGVVSNLIMREWESHFTHEYGWPIYAEYRHALMPYKTRLTNSQRVRVAAEFAQPLLTWVGMPVYGRERRSRSYIEVSPKSVQLSAFRRKPEKGYELRLVEAEGRQADARVEIVLPEGTVKDPGPRSAVETDLLGNKVADVAYKRVVPDLVPLHAEAPPSFTLPVSIAPWQIRTFHLE